MCTRACGKSSGPGESMTGESADQAFQLQHAERGHDLGHREAPAREQVRSIAEQKMADLNANDLDAAEKIIAGTARSMGVTVTE